MSKKKKELQFNLGIAGIIISLTSDDNNGGFYVDDAYKSFISEEEPEVILRAHWGGNPQCDSGEQVFDSGTTWRLLRKNKKIILKTISRTAILQSDFKAGDIHVPAEATGHRFSFPLNYPLAEVLMINLLSKSRGAMVHACGIDNSGEGLLFAGSSGAGKSTLARLGINKKGVKVLSDDRIIVRQKDGKFWIYGTPWHGDAKVYSPEKAPLEKILFLKHAENNIMKKIGPVDAASRLVVCSFPTYWDKKGMEFFLEFCTKLVQKVPCYEIGFVPDESVLNLVL